eukprot:s5904_g9.t1
MHPLAPWVAPWVAAGAGAGAGGWPRAERSPGQCGHLSFVYSSLFNVLTMLSRACLGSEFGIRYCNQTVQARRPSAAVKLDEVDDKQWRVQIADWRHKLGISTKYNPFDRLKLKIRGLRLTTRIKAYLNLIVADQTKELLRQKKQGRKKKMCAAISDIVVDVSQNPARRSYANKHKCLRTLCTSSVLVDLGKCRVILPSEMLWLQGHNVQQTSVPADMSASSLRKLAGEGMALPCIGLCVWAIYLTKGFPAQDECELVLPN